MNNRATSRHFHGEQKEKEKALAYYDQISRDYDHRVNSGILSNLRNHERRAVFSAAELRPPARTLIDIGCGGGYFSLAAKKLGFWVMSVDTSPGMIESLRGQVNEVQLADIETFETNRKFDRVLCLGVLDFVVNPSQALTHLGHLVASGGRLVILVPRSGWAGWIYRLEKKCVGIKVNLFEAKWIQNHLEREGLKFCGIQYPLPTNMVLAFERPEGACLKNDRG